MKIYLVGGSVRDHLLGVQSKDQDYMVEGTYEEMLYHLVEKCGYTIIHEKPEFLTARVRIPTGQVVDFACCRTEGDYDGRRPGTVEATSLHNDLSRRDFTVNAMAWEVDPVTFQTIGEIIDPFDGERDLRNKLLRFVGPPYKRLEEDGLRWLRAIRFIITKGFQPNVDAHVAIFKDVPPNILDKVSPERIKDELDKCFKYDTLKTIEVLSKLPPYWLKDNLWLKATLESK
jgi:tRNA nucleotidyltransferase/poly(A) polymerase